MGFPGGFRDPTQPGRNASGGGIAEDPGGAVEGAGGDALPIVEGFRGFDPDALPRAAEDGEGEAPAAETEGATVDGRRREGGRDDQRAGGLEMAGAAALLDPGSDAVAAGDGRGNDEREIGGEDVGGSGRDQWAGVDGDLVAFPRVRIGIQRDGEHGCAGGGVVGLVAEFETEGGAGRDRCRGGAAGRDEAGPEGVLAGDEAAVGAGARAEIPEAVVALVDGFGAGSGGGGTAEPVAASDAAEVEAGGGTG